MYFSDSGNIGNTFRKVILIVEKHDDIRRLMRLWIEMYGYGVLEATNGDEAVESVTNRSPNLILIDLSLPDMDCISVIKIIRNSENGKDIPIVAIASNAGLHEQTLRAGCSIVIGKPFDFEKLLQLICRYLPI